MSQISELLIVSISFKPSMSTFFLMSVLPTLFTMLRVMSVDSISRLNVILTVSGIITWSLEPCGISISICWVGYAIFGMLTLLYVLSCLWRQIVFYILPWDLILRKRSCLYFNLYLSWYFVAGDKGYKFISSEIVTSRTVPESSHFSSVRLKWFL